MSVDRPLVLGSTSPYRAELLRRLEVDFDIDSPRFDERTADSLFGELGPAAFAAHVARKKAESLRERHPEAWILAADQIAVIDGDMLTKPETVRRATDQLMRLSGRTHELITAVTLLDARTGECFETVDRQRLTMRAFDREEATRYVERHRPLDCVGSYRIEDAGIKLFLRIESADHTGIIGLPLLAVGSLLRSARLLG